MGTVTSLRDEKSITGELQDDLLKVVDLPKYKELTIAQIVGVIEFLKWNLINRSD